MFSELRQRRSFRCRSRDCRALRAALLPLLLLRVSVRVRCVDLHVHGTTLSLPSLQQTGKRRAP